MPRRNRGRQARGREQQWGSRRKQPPDWEPDARRERRDRPPRMVRENIQPVPPFESVVAQAPPVARVCGNCREWYPHEVGGRGDCSHPGSGFVAPWSDTPACPFFAPLR